MAAAVVSIAILFFVGHFLKWVFIQTKIPDLLILVGLGYLIGPTLGYISPSDFGKVGDFLTTLALVVILYEGGLSLHAKELVKSSLPAAGISFVGFILVGAVGFILAFLLAGQSWQISLLFALGMGSTSSAIVIPMVKHLTISEETKTILSLESAFTDVLAIVLFLVVVDGILSGAFSAKEILIGIGPKTILAVLMGLTAGFVWSIIRKKFDVLSNITFAGEAWALLSFGIIELSGHNGAMGVLALGFFLANTDLLPDWSKSIISERTVSFKDMFLLGEITFLLKTIFFIYLGILIKFSDWKIVLFALLISVIIFITRYLAVQLLFSKKGINRIDAMITVAMGPRGLACAVLATIPIQKGITGGNFVQDALFAVIPFSIILTALFVMLSENDGFRNKAVKLFANFKEEISPLKSLDLASVPKTQTTEEDPKDV